MSTSYWSGTCGQCHEEFAELQKTNHTDPLPFGYYEPTEGRLTVCYPCHYTPGYIGAIESGEDFHVFNYEPAVLTTIPRDTPNVSCSVCHDPHSAGEDNPYGLRTGSAGTACDTCHYEKWQNAILEGMAGPLGNGYHYPGEDYGATNWHLTEDKCVLCHMNTAAAARDENGILKLGGHTFRMRDFGPDNTPDTGDDLLNTAACQNQGCHPGLTDFDRNGIQTEVQELLHQLRDLLTENNHDFLPANKPGNCARCHKGGTVEFLDDPDLVLENAYTNYKLIANDRSRGIHNPAYIKKLLQDSINSINNDY
jgi:predicted CXXCH cytochrome family protein